MYEEKIRSIDEYIQRAESVVSSNDYPEAGQLQKEIIGVFENEIPNIREKLDTYNFYRKGNADYIGDVKLLKAKLQNYKINLSTGLFSVLGQKGASVQVSQQVKQENVSNITITLEETVSIVNQISKDVLSDEEKDVLNGKLAAISATADKLTRWEKAKNALKWITEKSIEVGMAALPYIVEALKR